MEDAALIHLCKRIPFLGSCGTQRHIDVPNTVFLDSSDAAKAAFYESGRDYLKVAAQGELTGWLASRNYNRYGPTWNPTAKRYMSIVEPITSSVLLPDFITPDFDHDLRQFLRSMLVLYAMEEYYSDFPKRPRFFFRMVAILEEGFLPCGCILPWPSDEILIY